MHPHPLTDKASLSEVRRAIRAELNHLGVDASIQFDCLVAITEACTTALVHTAAEGGETPFISWSATADEARFLVQDFAGQEWARAAHPSGGLAELGPTAAEDRVATYGTQMMRDLMDEVQVELGPEGTAVTLVKRFIS